MLVQTFRSESPMSLTTVIKNASGSTLDISEGSGGVYRKLKQLERKKTFSIKTDVNATYREYNVQTISSDKTPVNKLVSITSDDVMEYSEIEVTSDNSWTWKPRKLTGGSNNEEKIGLFRRILNNFCFGEVSSGEYSMIYNLYML